MVGRGRRPQHSEMTQLAILDKGGDFTVSYASPTPSRRRRGLVLGFKRRERWRRRDQNLEVCRPSPLRASRFSSPPPLSLSLPLSLSSSRLVRLCYVSSVFTSSSLYATTMWCNMQRVRFILIPS